MIRKHSLFKGSAFALLTAVVLKMVDLEKLWLTLSEMLECATLVAAVFVADTVVFHALPRLQIEFWKSMKREDGHVYLIDLPRYDMHVNSSYF